MQPESSIAFKEWSVVCAALASGRQTLILRKGGIHEGRAGFRVQHGEFWLFPTAFHQQRDEIVPEAWPLLDQAESQARPGRIALDLYAVVADVHHVLDRETLSRLSGRHIWSESTVEQRFAYRSPGLFVLVARLFRRPQPWVIDDSPEFAGCKSWVQLPQPLATSGVQPVLDEAVFEQRRREIQTLCSEASGRYLTPPEFPARNSKPLAP